MHSIREKYFTPPYTERKPAHQTKKAVIFNRFQPQLK